MRKRAKVFYPCPCCGEYTIETPGMYDICKVCGWEDDDTQSADPDYAGGANSLSLNQYKEQFQKKMKEKAEQIF